MGGREGTHSLVFLTNLAQWWTTVWWGWRMVTALLHVDDMVILLDDEDTMRLGLKILKNGVDSGQSRAVQAYLMRE